MKKIIYVQFLILLLLSSLVIAPTAVEFSDPVTRWVYKYLGVRD